MATPTNPDVEIEETAEEREARIADLLAKDNRRRANAAKRRKDKEALKAKIEKGEAKEEPNTAHQIAADMAAYLAATQAKISAQLSNGTDASDVLSEVTDSAKLAVIFLSAFASLGNLTTSGDYRGTQAQLRQITPTLPVAESNGQAS